MKNFNIKAWAQKISLVLIAPFVITVHSCNEFLDESPSKTTSLVVKTTAQLNALLNNHSSFYTEGNGVYMFGTDDYGLIKSLYDARNAAYAMPQIEFALWYTEFLPDNTSSNAWAEEYKKIFTANMVLEYVDKVEGPESDKQTLKADAHLIRAYSYFQLANTYCLPYTEQNKNEMGLTIKKSVSFEEPFKRSTLEEVYTLIESDLEEALKITVPLNQGGRLRHWRGNTAAVNGFAARYYLSRNNYEKAQSYAEKALAEYSILVDYNTEMRYGRDLTVKVNGVDVVIKYPYGHDNQTDLTDMFAWKEFLYFRMLNNGYWWYIPSQELIDLYDHTNDLRYVYHFVEDYSYERGLTNPAYSHPGYTFFFKDRLPSGPTVAEMILIKAECQARRDSYQDGINTVNILRAKRMRTGTSVNLTASSKDDAIKKILEERRREMPFVSRWYDIRRFNNNEYALDDVELTRVFYPYTISNVSKDEPVKTYTLPKTSRRYAAPIPRTEIISSQDEIQQNTY